MIEPRSGTCDPVDLADDPRFAAAERRLESPSEACDSRLPLRRTIAVVVSRFPLVTETFILREIEALERQGQPVRLVPLLRGHGGAVHEEARPWMSRALYTPFLSREILLSNLRRLARQPWRYGTLLVSLLAKALPSVKFFIKTLAIFPKSVYLAERLEEEGVGHVHGHFATHPATAALVVSELTGITFSFTAHAHDIFVDRAILGHKLAKASFVRCVSRFNRDFLRALYPAVPRSKYHVIHMGLDLEHGPYGARRTLPVERRSGPVRLLAVAALKPYKGISVLIEACGLLKQQGVDFRCDVVGEGPCRKEIETRIEELDLAREVRLLGALDQAEVARLVSEAFLVVLPSVVASDGQMEGIPVALMEAMAARRPVVATNLSGVPELVEHDVTGLLVQPGDAGAISRAILGIVSDPERARVMGDRGREKVRSRFRIEASVSRLLHLIDGFRSEAPEPIGALVATAVLPGIRGRTVGLRRVREGEDSLVLELAVADGGSVRDLVCKVHKRRSGESRPAPERARREYEILLSLTSGLAVGADSARPDRVPIPLGLDETAAAVVLESCRGRRLDELIRGDRTSLEPARVAAIERAVENSGRWLRWFQAQSDCRLGAEEALDRLAVRAEADLENCRQSLGEARARRIARHVVALRDRIAPRAELATIHHGDFWPGNVLVNGDTVTVLDFEGFRDGVCLEDVARFLLHLRLALSPPLIGFWLAPRRQSLQRRFLDGYLAGRAPDAALFQLAGLAAAMHLLSRSRGSGLRTRWQRRALRRVCREILGEGR